MGLTLLTERYAPQIAGVLSRWDRILLFGTLPKICFAEGMTSYLYERKIRIFDYPKFAEPFRNALRENAERLSGPDRAVELNAVVCSRARELQEALSAATIALEISSRNARVAALQERGVACAPAST